jgi:transposase-like protein
VAVSARIERITPGYCRFRCRDCGKQFNKRTAGSQNRTQFPSDVIALVEFWRLRYKHSLRDLPEIVLIRDIVPPRGGSCLGDQAHPGELVDVMFNEHRDMAAATAL